MVWGVKVYGLGYSRTRSFLCLVVFQDDGSIVKTPPGYQGISLLRRPIRPFEFQVTRWR